MWKVLILSMPASLLRAFSYPAPRVPRWSKRSVQYILRFASSGNSRRHARRAPRHTALIPEGDMKPRILPMVNLTQDGPSPSATCEQCDRPRQTRPDVRQARTQPSGSHACVLEEARRSPRPSLRPKCTQSCQKSPTRSVDHLETARQR